MVAKGSLHVPVEVGVGLDGVDEVAVFVVVVVAAVYWMEQRVGSEVRLRVKVLSAAGSADVLGAAYPNCVIVIKGVPPGHGADPLDEFLLGAR